METLRNPMTATWYYVEFYDDYYECFGTSSTYYFLIGLPGSNGDALPILKDRCRRATYEEVNEHFNQAN